MITDLQPLHTSFGNEPNRLVMHFGVMPDADQAEAAKQELVELGAEPRGNFWQEDQRYYNYAGGLLLATAGDTDEATRELKQMIRTAIPHTYPLMADTATVTQYIDIGKSPVAMNIRFLFPDDWRRLETPGTEAVDAIRRIPGIYAVRFGTETTERAPAAIGAAPSDQILTVAVNPMISATDLPEAVTQVAATAGIFLSKRHDWPKLLKRTVLPALLREPQPEA